ncbi:MAG: NADH-quinone oxidoreductase subunit C [Gammaproteobacteria bacterium]|nr:NADH-quinone oxidoreductase subunit C [Gammaproteobacteria bacterium]
MITPQQLIENLEQRFAEQLETKVLAFGEVTIEVATKDLIEVCTALESETDFAFTQLIDLCGVDYSAYGLTEWSTDDATTEGFSRGVDKTLPFEKKWDKPRFASVIHLISITNNMRLRIRTFADEGSLVVPSVTTIWNCAEWFERESFDLFGILYDGHTDLRRILTDYGFVGHPFRKDFPLTGNVEMRYDATERRCVYEPVSIEPRMNVPRVIRNDLRYTQNEETGE